MSINWNTFNASFSPIKGYADLCRRWNETYNYPFAREVFNYTMPQLAEFTRQGVGGDLRHRYEEYTAILVALFDRLNQARVKDVLALKERIVVRDHLEVFLEEGVIDSRELVTVLKYLTYWFIPGSKRLGGLIRKNPTQDSAVKILAGVGIRTNLELLHRGRTPGLRKTLAMESGLPEGMVTELVNLADLSRMPWASKATIANLFGAGYGSLSSLANADPQECASAFYRYGESIGKNLKFGNEIENCQRIARILPVILREDPNS